MPSFSQANKIDSPAPLDYHDHLIQSGLLTSQQLAITKEEQQLNNSTLRSVILHTGFLTEEKLLKWTCQEFSYDIFCPEQDLSFAHTLCDKNKQQTLYNIKAVPLKLNKATGELTVALADVLDVTHQDTILWLYPDAKFLKILAALEKDIIVTLDHLYQPNQFGPGAQEPKDNITYLAYDGSPLATNTSGLIDKVLENAVKMHASDIHFSPEELCVRVHFRVNGTLLEHHLFHISQWPTILSRLKILSSMNIAETRLPQSGRFSQHIAGRTIDFRASAHPTAKGENFVLRILDRLHTFFELGDLGFSSEHINQIKSQLNQPYGIVIMTGPTGSGKTTTLYSMLSYLKSSERNIMTLEDPIEYEMHDIRQTQIQKDIGFDFSDGVRSILRQDPDVILIGEIRDEATAKMALRAAMTGHLVLTTLHTNSALSAVSRLIDLGVEAPLLSGHINCILSQRLVKKPMQKNRGTQLGRRPVAEVLNISPELDALFIKRAPYHDLLQAAQKEGYKTMQDQAQELIKNKEITLDDVQRVLAYKQSL